MGNAQPTDGQTLTVNGNTITFKSGSAPAGTALPAGSGVLGNIVTDGNGNSSVYLGTTGTPAGTVGDLLTAIDLASGVQKAVINTTTGVAAFSNSSGTNAAIAGGIVTLTTGTGADLSITGEADLLNALKLTTSVGGGDATVTRARTTASTTLGTLIEDGSTLNINGKTVTFKNAEVPLRSERARRLRRQPATSSPMAAATQSSICRTRRSPTRSPRSISPPASRPRRTPAVRPR